MADVESPGIPPQSALPQVLQKRPHMRTRKHPEIRNHLGERGESVAFGCSGGEYLLHS